MSSYKIIRFYSPTMGKPNRIIKKGLTLEEAKEHCNNPKTRKEGKYFDGYTKEDR